MELQNHTQNVSFYLNEGDFSAKGRKLTKLGITETYEFENQLDKDDFIELDTTANDTVKKAETVAIGHLISEPYGNFPREDTAYGNLTELRKATVNFFVVNQTYNLKLSETSAAITSGDFVQVGADGCIEKASTDDTGARATESKSANSGGYIDVIITNQGGITVAEGDSPSSG